MIKIPPRRVKRIVEPWGTVSVNDLVFAVPKEYAGQEVYITISATIEPAEEADSIRDLLSKSGMTLGDLIEAIKDWGPPPGYRALTTSELIGRERTGEKTSGQSQDAPQGE